MSVERNHDFDDMLDEIYPTYSLGELTFYPSQILAECDPIAYRIALSEWEDEREEEEKERNNPYRDEVCEFCGLTATASKVGLDATEPHHRTIIYLCGYHEKYED